MQLIRKKVSECFAGFKKSCTFALAFRRKCTQGSLEGGAVFSEKTTLVGEVAELVDALL